MHCVMIALATFWKLAPDMDLSHSSIRRRRFHRSHKRFRGICTSPHVSDLNRFWFALMPSLDAPLLANGLLNCRSVGIHFNMASEVMSAVFHYRSVVQR